MYWYNVSGFTIPINKTLDEVDREDEAISFYNFALTPGDALRDRVLMERSLSPDSTFVPTLVTQL